MLAWLSAGHASPQAFYAASVQQNDTRHMFCNMRAAGYGTMTDVAHPVNEPSVRYVCFHTGGVVMM